MGAALSYGTGVPRAQLAAMVVGGGGGERLGGVSKPDLVLGGVRLVDRVCAALGEVAGGGRGGRRSADRARACRRGADS